MYRKLYFYLFLILLVSCGKPKDQDIHAGHSHDAKLQLTAYSDLYEAFAEVSPFAMGQTSEIRLHLTRLKDFKPVEKGQTTLSLIVGTQGIRQTLENPDIKGVYVFELKPGTAGEGKLILEIRSPEGDSKVEFTTIRIYEDAHEAAHSIEEKEQSGLIAFSKEQSWKIDFETGCPVSEPFGQVIKTTGQVQSSQGDETIIAARTSGIVVFEGKNIVEGENIVSGQTLFTVSGAGMAENSLNVRFSEAKNTYQKLETDYERALELSKQGIVSEKDLRQIRNDYETAKTIYENLHRNFTEKGQRVSSPGGGFVKQLYVRNGEYVDAGQPLVCVAKNKTLLIKAEIQQRYASVLPLIVSANFRDLHNGTFHTLEELNGRVLSFGKSIGENNYLIPVAFQIENQTGFFPGSFLEIYIRTKSATPVLTVPNTALIEDQGTFFVMVQKTPESFEKREVKTGTGDGIRTEIKSGLSPKERVVTKGAISVKLAEASGALDPHAGHVH